MPSLDEISGVVVTRGDVDLAPVLESLPFEDIVIWDNSQRPFDAKIFGRYLGALEARNELIFFSDDDAICTDIPALVDAWEPGYVVSNMDAEWVKRGRYQDMAFCGGAGGLCERGVAWDAIGRYLAEWPLDDEFLLEVDFVVGVLTPSRHEHVGYELRTEITERPKQLCKQSWQEEAKQRFMRRARIIRDGQLVAA